ncbi:MAG TPA: SCO family protein [Burkholderiales bacterium]|nr:SCO family protein [Burkholderiales bacterium]
MADLLARAAVLIGLLAWAVPAAAQSLDAQEALRVSQSVMGRQVPNFAFADREGRRVELASFHGKPLVVNFVYTGCFQVCPATTQFLKGVVKDAQDALGRDSFNVVTIGFNLPFDTPVAMKTFAKKQGIDIANWEFLSPDAGSVDELARAFGFSYVANPGGFDHVIQVTILDQQGRVYRQIYGESFEAPAFVGPLKDLITGAPDPNPTLAGLVEKVRILCTVYDPASGKYKVNYGIFLEILAGVVALGGTAWYLLSGRRRRHKGQSA